MSRTARREYRAEFESDGSALTFHASNQDLALDIAQSHAEPGEQFTLSSRSGDPPKAWADIARTSFWETPYSPQAKCKRVR